MRKAVLALVLISALLLFSGLSFALSEQELLSQTQANLQPKIDNLELLTAKQLSMLSSWQLEKYLSSALKSEKVSKAQIDTIVNDLAQSKFGMSFINSKEGTPLVEQYLKTKMMQFSFASGFAGFDKIEKGVFYPKGPKATSFNLDLMTMMATGKTYSKITLEKDGSLSLVANTKEIQISNGNMASSQIGVILDSGTVSVKDGPKATVISLDKTCKGCTVELTNGRVIVTGNNLLIPTIGTLSSDANIKSSSAELLGNGAIKLLGKAVFRDEGGVVYKAYKDTLVTTLDSSSIEKGISRIDIRIHAPDKNGKFVDYVKITPAGNDHIEVSDEFLRSQGKKFPYGLVALDTKDGKVTITHKDGVVVSDHQYLKIKKGIGIPGTVIQEIGTNQIIFGARFGTYHGEGLATPVSVSDKDFIGTIESIETSVPGTSQTTGPAKVESKYTGKETMDRKTAIERFKEISSSSNPEDLKAAITILQRMQKFEFGDDVELYTQLKEMRESLNDGLLKFVKQDPGFNDLLNKFQDASDNRDTAGQEAIGRLIFSQLASQFGQEGAEVLQKDIGSPLLQSDWKVGDNLLLMAHQEILNTYRTKDPQTLQDDLRAGLRSGQLRYTDAWVIAQDTLQDQIPEEAYNQFLDSIDEFEKVQPTRFDTRLGVEVYAPNKRVVQSMNSDANWADKLAIDVQKIRNDLNIPIPVKTVELGQLSENSGMVYIGQDGSIQGLTISLEENSFRNPTPESVAAAYSRAIMSSDQLTGTRQGARPSAQELMRYLISQTPEAFTDNPNVFQSADPATVLSVMGPKTWSLHPELNQQVMPRDEKKLASFLAIQSVSRQLFENPTQYPTVPANILSAATKYYHDREAPNYQPIGPSWIK